MEIIRPDFRFDDIESFDHRYEKTVTPSAEEIRYAEALRLQIREEYLRRPVPPFAPWCVGVD